MNLIHLSLLVTCLFSFSFISHEKLPAENWSVTTVAGWEENGHIIDGKGNKASFTWELGPSALDVSGNLFVIDQNCLRKVDPEMNVSTLFGVGVFDINGNSLDINPLPGQDGICTDKSGNIYVSSRRDHMIYKISPDKTVTPFAGDNGYKGKDDGPALEAGFNGPTRICMDKNGNIYVADTYNSMIRKISADGKVTTIAGNGQIGDFKPGTGKAVQFQEIWAIAVDSKGNVYVSQNGRGSAVIKITPAGAASQFAGDVTALTPTGVNHDGAGKAARFLQIGALAIDKDDNLIVGESTRIRKVSPAGVVTTLAGSDEQDWRDAAGAKARFRSVKGLSVDAAGNIFVSDQYCIRKMVKQ